MQEDNNNPEYRLWLSNTLRATLAHCRRLAGFCGCRLDGSSVESYISDIAGKRNRDAETSPFPKILRGYVRNAFQPKHLMLKLASVRHDETGTDYEFLVEYGLFEPATGIYLGIKAVSDTGISDDAFIDRADKAVRTLFSSTPMFLSNRRIINRPLTDNAEKTSESQQKKQL